MKIFIYILVVFLKGKHCMESKINEYGKILDQAEVNSRLVFTNCKKIWSIHLYFSNTLSYFCQSYDITCLENIHSITF